ncbi:MAG: formate dehydrogenase subunit delta [Gammaproteobacteria bacterium]|nr:formate dehydrogenase subunit delta [Gammaproteobacteria bacterium]MXW44438.1 formate dehydrogenase subunit delta [Gammaproteobacteria bacterium]MYD02650.1 formate dehydrogenase subunit delta [Gammaproteobacteria bacterium]MYE48957.1 formate dehydrogenase subunit delta [Gammaproteobacteria bacterium]MYI24122.1 formate dehydrogenase subunit delta [Gammaproteobacteria bacterium]
MNTAKLVRMANDIAANFDCGLDRTAEVAGVADHIGRFWSPYMIDAMAEHMRSGKTNLSGLAEQALQQLIAERQG